MAVGGVTHLVPLSQTRSVASVSSLDNSHCGGAGGCHLKGTAQGDRWVSREGAGGGGTARCPPRPRAQMSPRWAQRSQQAPAATEAPVPASPPSLPGGSSGAASPGQRAGCEQTGRGRGGGPWHRVPGLRHLAPCGFCQSREVAAGPRPHPALGGHWDTPGWWHWGRHPCAPPRCQGSPVLVGAGTVSPGVPELPLPPALVY